VLRDAEQPAGGGPDGLPELRDEPGSRPCSGSHQAGQARPIGADKQLSTETLLAGLYDLPEAPWKTINKGLPLTASDLAGRLREYDIKSHTLKSLNKKGYHRAHFEDPWRRYVLPPLPSDNAVTPVTNVTRTEQQAPEVTLVTPFQKGRERAINDGLDIPEWLRREPKVVRAPALGPVGDTLDDLDP
jgi:Protein of unknown function (DUF3631)